jgi:NTP pyrophosphatase (non-canonical NTP hydrolase)
MSNISSLKDIQQEVDAWIVKHGGYWPPLAMLSAVLEELGELAKEINHLEGYKPKKSTERENKTGEELADLLFAIVCIANHYNIDLSEEFEKIVKKYSKRNANRFSK